MNNIRFYRLEYFHSRISLLIFCLLMTGTLPIKAGKAILNFDRLIDRVNLVTDTPTILTWPMLATTTYYNKRLDTLGGLDVLFPRFSTRIKSLNNKRVSIRGYVIPLTGSGNAQILILSKYPNSSCFFCGMAGPETIIEVRLKDHKKRFRMDEQITFSGYLKLNDSDINYLNFIIEQAE